MVVRVRLVQEVLGSNPRGGKGAQGASTGLDLPRACLERRLSVAAPSGAAPLFWPPRGNRPLSRLGRGGFHLGVAAVASGSTPAKAAAMRPTLGVLNQKGAIISLLYYY